MAGFDNNLPPSILPGLPAKQKKSVEHQNKLTTQENQNQQQITTGTQHSKPTPQQSLVNTNSNININQPVLNSPVVNQSALNTTNKPQDTLVNDIRKNSSNPSSSSPSQVDYKGPSDLPAYAGIANMSLKSWVARNDSAGGGKSDNNKNQINELLDAIPGFANSNYEDAEGGMSDDSKNSSASQRKKLLILSQLFASQHSSNPETDFIVNIANYRKLGSALDEEGKRFDLGDFKFSTQPPPVIDIKDRNFSEIKAKFLHELFALPKEFPECLRLFANQDVEINSQYLKSFLQQRLKLVQGVAFGEDKSIGSSLQLITQVISQNNPDMMIPLLLLYYPLPIPVFVKPDDYIYEWKIKKKKSQTEESVVASCDIYYVSKERGRFLIRIILNKNNQLSVDIQTAKENNGIARDIERAIAEGMYLLEKSPSLSELNVMLIGEIYKSTDIDEELSIVSKGNLRLEIIIAAYSALFILNKLNQDSDPAGLIEML